MSGANRLVNSQSQIDGDSEETLREKLWNANVEAESVDKIELKAGKMGI